MSNIEQWQSPLYFVGEQDGAAERQLKTALISGFVARKVVQRSYLARISYVQGGPEQVALALMTLQSDSRDTVVEFVQQIFHSLFNVSQHLEIVFPSAREEGMLSAVCRAFYDAG